MLHNLEVNSLGVPSSAEEQEAGGQRDCLKRAMGQVASTGRRARLEVRLVLHVEVVVERAPHALVHRRERARVLCAEARAQATADAQHSQVPAAAHHYRERHEQVRDAALENAARADRTSDRTRLAEDTELVLAQR